MTVLAAEDPNEKLTLACVAPTVPLGMTRKNPLRSDPVAVTLTTSASTVVEAPVMSGTAVPASTGTSTVSPAATWRGVPANTSGRGAPPMPRVSIQRSGSARGTKRPSAMVVCPSAK